MRQVAFRPRRHRPNQGVAWWDCAGGAELADCKVIMQKDGGSDNENPEEKTVRVTSDGRIGRIS
jgi:hypothetical protein